MPPITHLFAYVGPETFLPVTSLLATIAGIVLMLWRSGARLMLKMVASRFRKERTPRVPNPHFATQPERAESLEKVEGQ
jgi:hypothetical protein